MAEAKELEFRNLAESKLERLPGLTQLLAWASNAGIRVVAVTNAPRPTPSHAPSATSGGCLRTPRHRDGVRAGEAAPGPVPARNGTGWGDGRVAVRAFEDSPTGLGAAVVAGVPTVGVLTAQPRDALEAAGASLCVGDFTAPELRAALEGK